MLKNKHKDNAPEGDYGPCFYCKTCGFIPDDMVGEGDEKINMGVCKTCGGGLVLKGSFSC